MAKTEKAADPAATAPAPAADPAATVPAADTAVAPPATEPAAGQPALVEGLVAQWRVDHDGISYGPGQPGGDALPAMPRAAAEALILSGAARAPAA